MIHKNHRKWHFRNFRNDKFRDKGPFFVLDLANGSIEIVRSALMNELLELLVNAVFTDSVSLNVLVEVLLKVFFTEVFTERFIESFSLNQ